MKLSIVIICLLLATGQAAAQPAAKQSRTFGLTLSLPWMNTFVSHDHHLGKSASGSGFMGMGIATFYSIGKNRFSLYGAALFDSPVPIGPVDYGKTGTRSNVAALVVEALYHHRLANKVYVLGGMNFTNYRFNFMSYVDTLPSFHRHDKTAGITFGTAYAFRKNFSLALFYRPSLVAFDTRQYHHALSLDARFDINIWKK